MEQWLWVLGPFAVAVLVWQWVRPRWERGQRPTDERSHLNRVAAGEARERRQRAKRGRVDGDPDW